MKTIVAAGYRSFATRLALVLFCLLLAYGALVAVIGRALVNEHDEESLQRLSQGLAQHIVEHWPQFEAAQHDPTDTAARAALMSMLMTVNPAVQVYVLDADGRVQHYIGEPGMVRQTQVDLAAVRAFLAGAALPLRGTDPMDPAATRIFSAAMFSPRGAPGRPPGYLYVVLDGGAREAVAGRISALRYWRGAGLAAAVSLLLTLGVGMFIFRRLTLPLRRLAARMRDYSQPLVEGPPGQALPLPQVDEVRDIGQAFVAMTRRVEGNVAREQRLAAAHREMMASVAHDLRTPLTALHGHLEALSTDSAAATAQRSRVLAAALSQSRKVGRLTQQLFEMAALQSTEQVLHRERFRLDELVTDAVQKFDLTHADRSVTLGGVPPGRLEFDGDLQLIERALTNLIDNALRHAPGGAPVRVSVRRDGALAEIWVEDAGPGLPSELHQRLHQGLSLRDPPVRRRTGGIGGLGLAIAQRVAVLHGGSLRPLPAPGGGTRLCLALPLAA